MTDENKQPESQQPTEPEVAASTQEPHQSASSEENEPPREDKTSAGRSIKRIFWYLVLVIILATIAWVLVDKPYQQLGLNFSSADDSASEEQAEANRFDAKQEVKRLAQQLANTRRQLTTLQEKAASSPSEQQVNEQQAQLQSLNNELSQQRQQLEQLARQLPERQFEQMSQWRLFEAKQTVGAAARLIWGAEDYPAALTLLKVADSQLAGIESAAAIQIRQVLAKDIARVEAAIGSPSDQLALTLAGLHQRLTELPDQVEEKTLQSSNQDDRVSAEAADWRDNLQANWNDFLDTFIRIQPSASRPEPLLSANERESMTLRLDLLMTMAQHAALKDNASLWRSYIDQALPIIRALKGNSNAVTDVIQRLTALRQENLDRSRVERLDALDALTRATEQGGLQ